MLFFIFLLTTNILSVYGAGPPGVSPIGSNGNFNELLSKQEDQGRSDLLAFPKLSSQKDSTNPGLMIESRASLEPPNGQTFAPPSLPTPINSGPSNIPNIPPNQAPFQPASGREFPSFPVTQPPPSNLGPQNVINEPRKGGFQFRGDNGAERSPIAQDYDYQSFDFTSQKDLRTFTSPLYRIHNSAVKRFYAHTNKGDIDAKKRQGFNRQATLGRMIPMLGWSKRRQELLQRCPDLIELKYFANPTGRQMLAVSSQRANLMRDGAWRQFSSLGVCVSRPNCGATEPLFELIGQRLQEGDTIYVTTKKEYDQLIQKGNYRDENTQTPVCFIWSK